MNQDIIMNPKTLYRKELVQVKFTVIKDNLLSLYSRFTDVSAKLSILDAIRYVTRSW